MMDWEATKKGLVNLSWQLTGGYAHGESLRFAAIVTAYLSLSLVVPGWEQG